MIIIMMAAKLLSAHHYLSKNAINTENIVKVSKACYLSAENSINVFVIVLQIVLFLCPCICIRLFNMAALFSSKPRPPPFQQI